MSKFLSIFNRTSQEDPLKNFAFSIVIAGFDRFGFSKATAPSSTADIIEYREGGMNTTPRKSPGLVKFSDITLERGQILAAGKGDPDALAWYTQVFDIASKKAGASNVFRRTVDLVQYDREGVEVVRWELVEAWPSAFKPTSDLEGLGSADSIESLTITYEGFRRIL